MSDKKVKVIDGDSYEISQPYQAGHVINEIEARVLNQCRSENIGNNVRNKIKELKEQAEAEGWGEKKLHNALQKLVEEADQNYVFTAAAARRTTKMDPVEREARKIAKALIRNALAEEGRKITDVPEGMTEEEWKDKIEDQISKLIEMPDIIAAAQREVEEKQRKADAMAKVASTISV